MPVSPAPRVSVVLPTHNRANLLGFAIQSVLLQTFRDFELLVVGDGCGEDTAAVVRGFADERVDWHDYPKAPGIGYANRNRALRRARGEIIAYLTDDDLWLPDHLERLMACLTEHDAQLAYSLPLEVTRTGVITPHVFNLHDASTRNLWRTKHLGYVAIANVIHRRECLEQYGYWNETMASGGDWELWMRIIEGGGSQSFAYLPLPTALHFIASWRPLRPTWRTKLLRRVREWEGEVLPELRLDLRAGRSEQEIVWSALSQAPARWTRDLRRAVQVEVDRRSMYIRPMSSAIDLAFQHYRRIAAPRKHWPKDARAVERRE
jgi:glycosyltransferase involved in cell wall biosynthesis